MKLRRFNEEGIRRMEEFLDSLTTDSPKSYPDELLTSPEHSEEVTPDVEVEQRTFDTRFDAADYLYQQLGDAGILNLERDKGLWSWLALFYFDQLCSPEKDGRLNPNKITRWIPEFNSLIYYRHLLAGPYLIFRANSDEPNRALALLCGPVDKPGEVVEQLASRQEIVTNRTALEVATLLYVDKATKKSKRGSTNKNNGGARRLVDILQQFEVTWDLYSISTDDLLNMLPGEFRRFMPSTAI